MFILERAVDLLSAVDMKVTTVADLHVFSKCYVKGKIEPKLRCAYLDEGEKPSQGRRWY